MSEKFELDLLNRVKTRGEIEIPLGDSEYIQHYFDIIDYLEKSGYIIINKRNNELVTAKITDLGIHLLEKFQR